MDFREIVMTRYAARQYDGRPIPEEKINELLEIVRFTPSGINLQPWKIKIVSDQKTKRELVPATFGQEHAAACSTLLVFCADRNVETLIDRLEALMKKAGAPESMHTDMIGRARGMAKSMPPERMLEWVKHQVYLAAGNALNAAKALGLDACPMTGFNPAEYSRILGLPEHLVPTFLVALGYATDRPFPKIRFELKDILI